MPQQRSKSKFHEQSEKRRSQQSVNANAQYNNNVNINAGNLIGQGNNNYFDDQERKPLLTIKVKDTNKIKTNPKYRCQDEGGQGLEDEDGVDPEDIGKDIN